MNGLFEILFPILALLGIAADTVHRNYDLLIRNEPINIDRLGPLTFFTAAILVLLIFIIVALMIGGAKWSYWLFIPAVLLIFLFIYSLFYIFNGKKTLPTISDAIAKILKNKRLSIEARCGQFGLPMAVSALIGDTFFKVWNLLN